MKSKRIFLVLAIALGLSLVLHGQLAMAQCNSSDPSSLGITPTQESFPGGEPKCGDLDGLRITPGGGAETIVQNLDGIPGNNITVVITVGECGEVMSWSVPDNIFIDQVVAKGGTDQNVYDCTGESVTSDGNLHCPTNNSGKYADFSHIDICFHYKLDIEKTAVPEFTRTYDWSIDKSCDGENPLTISAGQTFNYPFSWTASVAGHTDSDWKVTGDITIENNTPYEAVITSISDKLSDGTLATVTCNDDLSLLSGETLVCTYTADLNGAVNGVNTVVVETSTPMVEGGTATAGYTFGEPTTKVDECIEVTDDCESPITVCVADAPKTHSYTCPVGPYEECGEYTYTNTASFVTNDRGVTGTDFCVITVDVPCVGGCTRTLGYWKTHSKYGPAPYDEIWEAIGEDSEFFLSGQSYYQVLWTPAAGNVYYNLAHQYIAAELNFLAGADPFAAQSAFDAATDLFEKYTPDYTANLKGKAKKEWTDLATVLDNYNNGIIGPGHCDEDDGTLGKQSENMPTDDFESAAVIPTQYALEQNYPNPFNPVTSISYALPEQVDVTLNIYDIQGKLVQTLVKGNRPAGAYTVTWDATNSNGEPVTSGIYLYRMNAGDFTKTGRMTLLK